MTLCTFWPPKKFTDTTPVFCVCSDTVNTWELLEVFTIVPGDPALIRSDNTVRNGISTIGLQSLSPQSKGLLKHSAAQQPAPSLLLFFLPVSLLPSTHFFFTCFSLSLSFSLPLYLSLSFHPFWFTPSLLCKRERRAWIPHTQTVSRPLHSNITAARFFPSQVNHSASFFPSLQETVVKMYSPCPPFIFNSP